MTRVESNTQLAVDELVDAHARHCGTPCTDLQPRLLAIQDAMAVLSGKWKIQLLGNLTYKGKQRFSELLKSMNGIRAKMLSKELQELEANQLISRSVKQTKPLTVEYEITPYGRTLEHLISAIVDWGLSHRERIMKGD